MAMVYKSICNEADSLFIRITKLTEKEIRYKVEIEKLMNKGFVNIAKARYIMGSTWVTKLQLPTGDSNPIQPLATVCRAQFGNHWVFHIHTKDFPTTYDEKNGQSSDYKCTEEYMKNRVFKGENSDNEEENIPVNESEAVFKCMLQNDPRALKRSKIGFYVDDKIYNEFNEELLDEMSTDSDSSASVFSITDPIRLFGILVPNTLKEAQHFFKDVVGLLGKCATLQSELREVLFRYNHLEMVKHYIEDAAKETELDILKPKVYWTPSETSSISCHPSVASTEKESESSINVQKSIRSVFYDLHDIQPQEGEVTIWTEESSDADFAEN